MRDYILGSRYKGIKHKNDIKWTWWLGGGVWPEPQGCDLGK